MADKINERKISKRDQILAVSGRLFMENGFQSVSMDQIAATVPVSKPTLYAHFEDKRALFYAVVEGRCGRALATLKEGIENHRGLEEGLRLFGKQFLELLLHEDSLRFHRVMVAESASFPEMAQMFYETGPKKMHQMLCDFLVESGKPAGIMIDDPAFSADMFISMIKGRLHLKCLLGIEKVTLDDAAQHALVNRVIQIFLNGHRPTKN